MERGEQMSDESIVSRRTRSSRECIKTERERREKEREREREEKEPYQKRRNVLTVVSSTWVYLVKDLDP